MKFLSLQLQNILSHESTSITLDHLTCFRGENGGGKSTIISALQALACGTADATDARGSGIQNLLRKGQDKGCVLAEIEDGGKVRKVRCGITEKSGRSMACKMDSDAGYTGTDYLAYLAMKRDVLTILINPKSFFGNGDAKAEASQKELLASIILPATVELEPWVWAALTETNIGGQIRRDLKPFDLISSAYDVCYKERTAVNRAIKEWIEPEKPTEAGMPVADIRVKLKARQDQRTELAIKKNSLLGKWQTRENAKAKAAEKLTHRESQLATERARRSDVAKGLLSKAKHQESCDVVKCADSAKEADAEIARLNAEIAATRKTTNSLNDLIEAGRCPTCTQPILDEFAQSLLMPIADKLWKLEGQAKAAQQARKILGDFEGARKDLAAHNQADKDLKLIDTRIGEIEKEIGEMTKEAESDTQAQPDTAKIDAELADMDARIEKGQAALQSAVRAEALTEAYTRAIESKKQLDAKQSLLEMLVDYFGPKGVQTKLLDSSVGPFQSAMNAVLSGWGFECRLQFEPFSFEVGHIGKQLFPLKTISASQRASFAVAFQVALSKTTGLNFVCVDAADVWLDVNRGMLYKSLMGAGLDQVIVLQSDLRREIPKVPNSCFYMLSLDKSIEVPKTIVERLEVSK